MILCRIVHLLQNFAFRFIPFFWLERINHKFGVELSWAEVPVSKIYDFHVRDYSGLNFKRYKSDDITYYGSNMEAN